MPRRPVDMREELPGKPSTLAPQIHSASRRLGVFLSVSLLLCCVARQEPPSPAPAPSAGLAIRLNQVGYLPDAPKVAVVCALEPRVITSFSVVDEHNRRVFGPRAPDAAGPFGPCAATYRLDFSTLRQTGVYRIEAAGVTSLPVRIGDDVYRGTADSLLAYLREQRSGYNPVFRDSVHQRSDGVLVDHPTRSGEFIAVSGGWADLQQPACVVRHPGLFLSADGGRLELPRVRDRGARLDVRPQTPGSLPGDRSGVHPPPDAPIGRRPTAAPAAHRRAGGRAAITH